MKTQSESQDPLGGLAFSSWNVNMAEIPDKVQFYGHLERLQPRWFLGMNGLAELAGLRVILPRTQLIHRWKVKPPPGGTHPDDDDNPTAYTPQQWLDRREANLRETGVKPGVVWLYTNNESGHKDEVLRWLQDVIKLAVPRGHKLVVYNGSVGTPGPDPLIEWQKPEAQELLRLCALHKDQVVLGLHEYGAGIVTSGFVGGLPTGINPENGERVHPDYTNPANWPDGDTAKDMSMWHCGRFKFVNRAAPKAGLRILITEYAPSDRINSGGYDHWLNSLPVTGGHKEIRGPMTARKFWETCFPGLGAEEAAVRQDTYAEDVVYFNSNVEGILRFTMSEDAEWVAGGFGYGVATDGWSPEKYYKLVEDAALLRSSSRPAAPPTPVEPPGETLPLPFPFEWAEWETALLKPVNDEVNIRVNAGTQYGVLATVDAEGGLVSYAKGYPGKWVPVQFDNWRGWVHRDYAVFAPPPVDARDRIAQLEARLATVEQQLALVVAVYNKLVDGIAGSLYKVNLKP